MDKIVESIEKTYFGMKVVAFKTENTIKYYPSFPWRFEVHFNGTVREFWGMPNYVETRAKALKRAWYRAKWLHEDTYRQKYTKRQPGRRFTV